MLRNPAVTQDVTDPKEYREAVDAAETLGLELKEVTAHGYGWESPESDAVHPDAGSPGVDIRKVGRKYFHMALRGPDGEEIVPVACGKAYSDNVRDAKLKLYFK